MKDHALLEKLRVFLPKFLSAEQHSELLAELRAFPTPKSFYLPSEPNESEILQADGWQGFVAIDVVSGDRRVVSGVVLSNSCDMDLANPRTLIPRIIFSPLIALDAYVKLLETAGMAQLRMEGQLQSIRRQEVTNIFYLPSMTYGPAESIILLDGIHVQPMDMFLAATRTRLFRLNQVAFYAFLLKLSIHFTRMQEGVNRFPASKAS